VSKTLNETIIERIGAILLLKSESGIWVAIDSENRLVVSTDKETWEELKLDEAQSNTIAGAGFRVK
jgi:hypothetical protein